MADNTTRMSKTYNPGATELRLYNKWESGGYFRPETQFDLGIADRADRPFVISMPPSNVTGELHAGHGLVMAIEDTMIRWHRMRAEPTLWLPGNDHASIGTHNVIEKALAQRTCDDLLAQIGYPLPEDGRPLTRWDLGREWFVKLGWAWREQYGNAINRQIRRLGGSCDWQRERFTMDEGLSRAVRESFVQLYHKGLIYRGAYLINWCPRCSSAISDLEVVYWEEAAHLWTVRYPLINDDWPGPSAEWGSGLWAQGASEWIEVATTRPETILGDTAVAVNPSDARYTHLLGRMAIVPAVERRVPIIADEAVDPTFGTGAVKITPAHDPDDYQVGQRHGLEQINVMTDAATMNDNAGPYSGQDRYACRENLISDLRDEGLLVAVKDHEHSVGHCERCDTVIEPRVSTQWFVRIKPLAQPAIDAVQEGRIQFIPDRFAKVYFNWMENIRDWCISRQLYWGHRIPVWYCDECDEVIVAREDPTECPRCSSQRIHQDPDILDTWFSSALWPFSTLGWPDRTEDLRYFYPTTVMETGYDIIFFWVARMIMMGLECTGDVPFRHVYLHGMVRDEEGRKMSRSRGNVIDPIGAIEEYGADALRFTLMTVSTPGNDTRLSLQRVEATRNFANKVWNAARFVIGNMPADRIPAPYTEATGRGIAGLDTPDRWILSRHDDLVANVSRLMESYQFGEAGRQIHDFLWNEFCDWYIEISKLRLYGDNDEARETTRCVLITVLERSLRLLHPFMPFVTEEIWQHLTGGQARMPGGQTIDSIMFMPWPTQEGRRDAEAEADMEMVMELVRAIRNARAEYGVDPGRRIAATIVGGGRTGLLLKQREVLTSLAQLDPGRLTIVSAQAQKPQQALALMIGGVECYLPLAGMVDLAAEQERLSRELEDVSRLIARTEELLANLSFLTKAPAHVVEREREKLAQGRAERAKLKDRLEALQGK